MTRPDLRRCAGHASLVAGLALVGPVLAQTACGRCVEPTIGPVVDAATDHRDVESADGSDATTADAGSAEAGDADAGSTEADGAGNTLEAGADGALEAGDDACVRLACGDVQCGIIFDGCTGTRDCGHCAPPAACWQGACVPVDSLHDAGCKPTSCDKLGFACGIADDGCGALLDCGHCTAPTACGGVDGHHCAPLPVGPDGGPTCASVICSQQPPLGCGSGTDGCGNPSRCGPGDEDICVKFAPGETCGGSGVHFQCGTGGTCVPLTCAPFGYDCGLVADGCGGFASCGTCAPGHMCGAGGFNMCGPGP